ncbi:cytochrome c biogenesis protein [bacterium]|jgi:heme exporter protein C|nr:cytochrome c biogenesis protein CcsA [Acidimicrobiaceae bacterium]MCH9803523.1 cytochrome c biogenesis protein CcsA [bacterium]MDA9360026.1 cytochrome c biogenesis protein [bacterium]MDB9846356.1 cytochrome c biogenesis protein [Acidimicrobiales bacterium]MDC0349412.1 cytochrome c biogenesis protein [bacterium]
MTITSAAPQTNSVANNPGSTGSTATRVLGLASLVGLAVLLVLAFVITDPDQRVFDRGADLEPLLTGQGDAVRLLYVHFPVAMVTYIAFSLNAVGSIAVLWKKSTWWDNTAAAAAEVGVLFCGLTLVTGSIWGRPIWNTWWKWGDVRLMTTTILFLIFVGYLAYRRTMTDSRVRAKRSAVVGLIGAINIPIVYKSVDWWQNRTLHQQSTLRDRSIEDLTLFAMIFGMVVFVAIFAWLMIHRFRIGWLEHQTETVGLEAAIEERRAQTPAAILDAVTDSRPSHETGSD